MFIIKKRDKGEKGVKNKKKEIPRKYMKERKKGGCCYIW